MRSASGRRWPGTSNLRILAGVKGNSERRYILKLYPTVPSSNNPGGYGIFDDGKARARAGNDFLGDLSGICPGSKPARPAFALAPGVHHAFRILIPMVQISLRWPGNTHTWSVFVIDGTCAVNPSSRLDRHVGR